MGDGVPAEERLFGIGTVSPKRTHSVNDTCHDDHRTGADCNSDQLPRQSHVSLLNRSAMGRLLLVAQTFQKQLQQFRCQMRWWLHLIGGQFIGKNQGNPWEHLTSRSSS